MSKIKQFLFGVVAGGMFVGSVGYFYAKQSIDLLLWSNNMHYASQIENNLNYMEMLDLYEYKILSDTLERNTQISIESLKGNLENGAGNSNSYYSKVFKLAEESGFTAANYENI